MARNLPSLNALKAFESAARHASFSRAADELNVTHAAISRHIRDLEAMLRAKLFVRTGRGVRLTESGEALAADLSKAFDLISDATAQFARPLHRKQRLMVTSDVSFAALWLVPRLGRFTSQFPGVDLIIDANHRLVDFDKEDVDLGIRFGGGAWRDVEAVKLIDADTRLVCAPALARSLLLVSPTEIDGASLIQENNKAHWQAWLEAAGVSGQVVPSGPTVNGDLAIAAAEAGQGFALADHVQAGDALLAGRLVAPFDIVVRCSGYYLVSGHGKPATKLANDFRAWLVAEIAAMSEALATFQSPRRARKSPRERNR